MDQIEVQFPEKFFYSKENAITNDFHITITNGLTRDLLKANDNENNENIYPTVCISGLEKLFINEDSMAPFAEALGNGIKDWSVSYGSFKDYGKCLIIKAQQKDIYTVTFSVTNYDFTALSKAKFDCRTKGFGIKIFIDNFNTIYKQYPGHTEMVRSVSAYEMPCIKEFATYYQGEKVEAVPNGEEAEIRWTLGNSDTAFNLYDENDTPLNVVSPYKVKINKDQKFKLKVELNGKEISQTLFVKDAPYIEDFYVEDKKKNKNKVMEDDDEAYIFWNVRCAEKFSTTLYRGEHVVSTEPGVRINAHNDTYTLKVKKENIEVTKTLPIYSTLWFKDPQKTVVNNLFRPNEKGYNNFFYSEKIGIGGNKTSCGHFIYVHPAIYYTQKAWLNDDFHWSTLVKPKVTPTDFIHYNCFYNSNDQKRFVICYTCKDFVKIMPSNLEHQTWGTEINIIGQQWKELNNNGTLLYCHYWEKSENDGYIFAVYESFIKIYRLYNSLLLAGPWTIKVPSSETDSTKIVSIDTMTSFRNGQKNVLAILCKKEQNGNFNGNQVYIYDIESILKDDTNANPQKEYEYKEKEQKTLYLVDSNRSVIIILDNCVFSFDKRNEECWSDLYFNPKETIIEEKHGFMLIGNSYDIVQAIVQNGDETSNWVRKR